MVEAIQTAELTSHPKPYSTGRRHTTSHTGKSIRGS